MPQPSHLQLQVKPLPNALPLRKLMGPSFILLGLGLGSGEVILWPFLASNYGLGMLWGALIGITMQFFINMEVERYALINGESVFVGFSRLFRWLPTWFIISTFVGFGWPGIGLSGAYLLSRSFGGIDPRLLAILLFIAIGLVLSIGKVLYQTVERLQKVLIGVGVPAIFLLAIYLSRSADWLKLGEGLVGQGEGFIFLPAGISLLSFLGALAYSGAGGNLNLAQSFYIRDKGYGMGAYADQIKSLLTKRGEVENIRLAGTTFKITPENMARFREWWKRINLEHLIIFWFLGLLTMCMLSLLAYVTTFGMHGNSRDITFVVSEAHVIGQRLFPAIGVFFLIITGVMLTATQLTVLDSTSRIITENWLLLRNITTGSVSRTYYTVLWLQILFGVIVIALGLGEPRLLLTLGAAFNAIAMFVHIGLILILNNRQLAQPLRPSWWRNAILAGSFVFLGYFSMLSLREFARIFGWDL